MKIKVVYIKTVFNILTVFLCIITGASLPIIALNLFGSSYEAPWVLYSCISIALLQYLGIGIVIYLFLNPACAIIFACCLLPFYLNFVYQVLKKEGYHGLST